MSTNCLSFLLLLRLTCYFSCGSCGNVLAWPVEYSHWINMKMILDQLFTRGHDLTVLTSSVSILIDPNKPSAIKFEAFHASLANDDYWNFIKHFVKMCGWMCQNTHFDTFLNAEKCNFGIFWYYYEVLRRCFKQETYDKAAGIKVQGRSCRCHWTCGELLAEIFKMPLMYSLCFTLVIQLKNIVEKFHFHHPRYLLLCQN